MFLSVKNNRRDVFILTYAMLVALAANALFLHGFFPVKYDDNPVATMSDVPDHVGHVRINKNELYRPVVKKVVIMVIDALRWDFITGPIGSAGMPITNSLIRNSSSCLMQAKANPPTVTMPRIKAMMTGAVPSFIDVALNFGDLPVSSDSFILQAKNYGHKLHFYGDDTWIKLFPKMFHRHEGTHSFFVNDFTEVDDNVTRHVERELEEKDEWTMLVLHYLGLDHIGHTVGPFSPLVKPKLREMDSIIGRIHREVTRWNKDGLPAIFVICGDHGMKDTGGHGGSTPEETLVPFLIFGPSSCVSDNDKPNRMTQVDMASMLSMMLALPIPSPNVGSIPIVMLNGLSESRKLFFFYYNSQQVFKQFKKLPGYESTEAFEYYEKAVKIHVDWLTNQKDINAEIALNLYNKAMQNMKNQLIHSMIHYDLHTMTIAMIFMGHVIYIMINGHTYQTWTKNKMRYWILGSVFSYLILYIISKQTISEIPNFTSLIFTIPVLLILILNSYVSAHLHCSLQIKKRLLNFNLRGWIFPLGMIAHIISLTSSSFIEEENQTWYHFWTTFLIVLLYDITTTQCNVHLSIKIILCLLGHRILRKLNSTGNKYAHLPDISNWLRDQESNAAMTSLLIGALAMLVWIGYLNEDKKHKKNTLVMHSAAAICIYLRHTTDETVANLPFYRHSRGIMEVQIFWILVIFYCIYWALRLFRTQERKIFMNSLLRLTVQLWVMISALLHRPYNVFLLPMQLIFSSIIDDALQTYDYSKDIRIYVSILMGNVFYFYQGNSNSLATIDVLAGYVGLENYNPTIAGLFLSINTFSAPVLSYLTLVYSYTLHEESSSCSENLLSVNRLYALWRFLPGAVYTIIATSQRFHLFVWTVFSPKLLYEAVHCLVTFVIILTMQLICTFLIQ